MINIHAFDEYKYKIELHAHTMPASGCAEVSAPDVARIYKNLGYDALVITNHFYYPYFLRGEKSARENFDLWYKDYLDAKEEGDKIGISILFGLEALFKDSSKDFLVYGVDYEIALELLSYIEKNTYEEFRNAWKPKKSAVIIQAHPCRGGDDPIDPAMVDGYEAFNLHTDHNSRIGTSASFAHKAGKLVTAGSDFHTHGHEGTAALLTKTVPKDSFELADVLKSRDYILSVGGFLTLPYDK